MKIELEKPPPAHAILVVEGMDDLLGDEMTSGLVADLKRAMDENDWPFIIFVPSGARIYWVTEGGDHEDRQEGD